MTWKRFAPGERFTGLPADEWNLHAEAARRVLHGSDPPTGDPELADELAGVVLLKNETDEPRGRFDVVELAAPIIGPRDNPAEFGNRITFRGAKANQDTVQFAILQEPLGDKIIGDAAIAGVTWARVKVKLEDVHDLVSIQKQRYARPTDDPRWLALANAGTEILWLDGQPIQELFQEVQGEASVHWAIIRLQSSPGETLERFTLTERLYCGGQACAQTLPLDGSQGKQIKVIDPYGDRAAQIGYIGWAVKLAGSDSDPSPGGPTNNCADGGTYYIVEVDHTAKGVLVELKVKVSSTRWKAQLVHAFDGRFPPPPPGPPPPADGYIDVYDEHGLTPPLVPFFPKAQVGAKGMCIFDPCAGVYRLYHCQQHTTLLWAVTPQGFCGGSNPSGLTQQVQFDFSPFNLLPDPLPAAALNILKLAAMPGDWIVLAWSEADQDWIVLQTTHHEVEFLIDLRANPVFCALEGKKQKAWVPLCTPAADWQPLIQLAQVTVATDLLFVDTTSGSGSGTGSGQVCQLLLQKKLICTFPGEVPAAPDYIHFTPQEVLIDVFDTGAEIAGTAVVVYVACLGSPYQVSLIDTVDCSSGSGSGSGSGC